MRPALSLYLARTFPRTRARSQAQTRDPPLTFNVTVMAYYRPTETDRNLTLGDRRPSWSVNAACHACDLYRAVWNEV
jgi:hypothetical protein